MKRWFKMTADSIVEKAKTDLETTEKQMYDLEMQIESFAGQFQTLLARSDRLRTIVQSGEFDHELIDAQ